MPLQEFAKLQLSQCGRRSRYKDFYNSLFSGINDIRMVKFRCSKKASNLWNSLPQCMMVVLDLDASEKELETFMEERSIADYKSW